MDKRGYLCLAGVFLATTVACSLFQSSEIAEEEPYAESPAEPVEHPTLAPPLTGQALEWCPGPQPPFITSYDVLQAPSMEEPPARQPFREAVFGTCLVRVTDSRRDLFSDDPSTGMKNEYSRVNSFNAACCAADGGRILVRSIEARWYLYDAATLQPMGELPLSVEPRWDAEDPNLIYDIDETRLRVYDLRSGVQQVVHDFQDDFPGTPLAAAWTRYEGSPTMDTRYWGMLIQDEDWQVIAYVIYDRLEDRITARREVKGGPSVDAAWISPLGNYFMVGHDEYCPEGQLGDDAHPCGLMVYDRNLKNGRSLLRLIGHNDPALDANGREVLVYQDIDTDHIAMLDLETGAVTNLFPIDFTHTPIGLHFSGRAFDVPGWVVISTYDGDPRHYTWMDDSVFAVELKAGGRVVRLAHHYSLVDENQEHDYWAESHASVNRDFTRILFTSNWGRSGTGRVETWMIVLPPDWISLLP